MLRLLIGIDWDDVTAPFNSIAVKMANEQKLTNTPLRLSEIKDWANKGKIWLFKGVEAKEIDNRIKNKWLSILEMEQNQITIFDLLEGA